MAIKVLGPLETSGEALSPRERAILSALVVRIGTTVGPGELADAVWGDAPPTTWEQQIRNSVARIRTRLGRTTVETVGPAYRLAVDPDAIDAVRFERLVSSARGHALRGEDDRAVDAYQRSLALWRGAPLQDLDSWEPATAERLRLEEIRDSAEEELLDSRLATGETSAVIADAERLVREDPLREARWAILALANYRADRQADALATLRAARERLDEELGIEPSARLTDLERSILNRAAELDVVSPASPISRVCPYPGLRPFGTEEADLYFGREADIENVLDRLGVGTVVTIAGPSGTGKSSLLLAGVKPRLLARRRAVEVVRPALDGVAGLARAIDRADVVAVDQAEEIVHLRSDDARAFTVAARVFLESGGTLILTLRSDALDDARALPEIGDAIGGGIYLLGPLSEQALREAIVEPARRAGLRLEPGLIELIIRDAGDRSSTLPHLSHALQETWTRREGSTLTVDGYRAAGGIAGAIAQSAESAFATLAHHERDLCRSLLLRLVDRDPDGSSTRRRMATAPLIEDPQRREVVNRLASARIITVDDETITIAHEAVARAWPRLDAWLEEGAEGARILRSVESAALAWDADGRSDDDLPRGARLHALSAWREASDADLMPLEDQYIERALAEETARQLAAADSAARDRRQNRRLRWTLGGAAVLLVVALAAGGLAAVRGAEAAVAAEQEQIEALAATSLSIRATDRDVAALLAAQLTERWPEDSRARSAVLGSIIGAGGLITKKVFDTTRTTVRVIPGTRTALVTLDTIPEAGSPLPGEVVIVDVDTGETLRELEVDLPTVTDASPRFVAVSGNGAVALIQTSEARHTPGGDTCCVNWLTFVDLRTGLQNGENLRLDSRTGNAPAFSPSGDRAYIAHPVTGDPMSFDTTTGAATIPVTLDPDDWDDVPGERGAIALRDGAVVVGHESELVLHDPITLVALGRVPLPAPNLASFFVLPQADGGFVVSGVDGIARLAADASPMWIQTPEDQCLEAAVTGDDSLVCMNWNGNLVDYELATGTPTGRRFNTLSDWTGGIDTLSGGEFVTHTMREPAAFQTWRLDGSPAVTEKIADGRMAADGFGSDGKLVVTAQGSPDDDGSGGWTLWDVDEDAPVGDPAEEIRWLTDDIYWRWDGEGSIHDLRTGTTTTIDERLTKREDGTNQDYYIASGGHGPNAFVVATAGIAAFDPATGEQVGQRFGPRPLDLSSVLSVSELGDTGEVALTRWNDAVLDTVTTVYSLDTGDVVRSGLEGDDQSVATTSGDIVSASAARLTRSSAQLVPLYALAKSGVGPSDMQITGDDRTLLLSGYDNNVALYDLGDGQKLGDEIETGSIPNDGVAAGFISADGVRMVTAANDGILLWDLTARAAASGCLPHRGP